MEDCMKTKVLFLVIFTFIFLQVFAQQAKLLPSSPEYAAWKQSLVSNPDPVSSVRPSHVKIPRNNQNLLIPWDASFELAMGPNDDEYTSEIACLFPFSFFGEVFNSFYINNNGNVSFGTPFYTFSSTGFPIADFKMLAPFWADVDTRQSGGGYVWYKKEAHRVVVIWDAVGYFNSQTDKLNTFELIFSDGTDPILGVGYWAGFSYDTMQWTTGSASGGSGGFYGTPATVGVNKGDGTNFFQIGRFDHPGTDYDGPGDNADGISFLDGRLYKFGGTGGDNTPPIFQDVPVVPVVVPPSGSDNFVVTVLSPEIGETTNVIVTDDFTSGFSYEILPGNPASVTFHIIANAGNVGLHHVTISATDDGVPPQTSNTDFYITVQGDEVLPVELSSFTATLTGENFVNVTWITQSETSMLGYNVFRNDVGIFSTASQLNQAIIPATNTSVSNTYQIIDPEVENGHTYYYWLQGVEFNNTMYSALIPVSYTHLTLPTICSVQISVVAVSLKKKKKDTVARASNRHKRGRTVPTPKVRAIAV
eukprot:TRINITY_DN4077_c0_g1_i1.p1 TRINITY_DN4077_c0_g1~~TRINITY_DN4077_c0_g1_i1.p1  ORF type:complete len:533 (-),score=32.26 TRINITY_DN4077_c0_g1_i1:36-1634(-)